MRKVTLEQTKSLKIGDIYLFYAKHKKLNELDFVVLGSLDPKNKNVFKSYAPSETLQISGFLNNPDYNYIMYKSPQLINNLLHKKSLYPEMVTTKGKDHYVFCNVFFNLQAEPNMLVFTEIVNKDEIKKNEPNIENYSDFNTNFLHFSKFFYKS